MIKYYDIIDADGGGGDPPAKPAPPKGYKPTNPQQRSDWNGFLDYVGKAGGDLDKDPTLGAKYMNEYKKQNPKFSLTPDQIPNIQYEGQQIRSGDSFGNLTPDQLKQARAGLSPNFLNNTATSKMYYPQYKKGGQDLGTDMEGYVKGAGQTATPSKPITKPGTTQGSLADNEVISNTPTKHGANPANQPAGAIPLPNYDDPKSRAAYLVQAKQKYGGIMQGRGDAFIHVNEVPDGGTMTAKDSATKAASKVGLDPALLYSSAMEEGMSGMYPGKDGKVDKSDSDKYPIDGFHNFGLDNFHDQFKTMVAKGYLPKDFDYEKAVNTNENKQKVNSANFKTPEDAMQAKAAYVKMEQDDIDGYAQKKGITLSPKARQFFTLINFNGGEGTGHKMIDYYKSKGLLEGDKFIDTPPEEGLRLAPSWKNVVPRMKMAEILKKEGQFQ